MDENRVCTHCWQVKPPGEFYVRKLKGGRTSLYSWCRACHVDRGKRYWKAKSGILTAVLDPCGRMIDA